MVWHSRLVVAARPGGPADHCYVVTPDDDHYEEELFVSPDVAMVHWLSHWKSYPAAVRARDVYEFAAMPTAARRLELCGAAFTCFNSPVVAGAAAWAPQLVAPAAVLPVTGGPGPAPGGLAAQAAILPGPGGFAAQAATLPGGVLGPALGGGLGALALALGGTPAAPGALAVPAVAVLPGAPAVPAPAAAVAVAALPAGPLGDVRILAITYDSLGVRFKEFREAVNSMREDAFADWPVPGPRTLLWLLRFFLQNSGSPLAWFGKFKADGDLSYFDEGIEELERSLRFLQTAACYDQQNLANSASAELVARSVQVTVYAYAYKFIGDREDAFERGLMYGTGSQGEGCLPVCPALREYLAGELQKRNAIDKERRKAQEGREHLSAAGAEGDSKKDGRGGKRGGRRGR